MTSTRKQSQKILFFIHDDNHDDDIYDAYYQDTQTTRELYEWQPLFNTCFDSSIKLVIQPSNNAKCHKKIQR